MKAIGRKGLLSPKRQRPPKPKLSPGDRVGIRVLERPAGRDRHRGMHWWVVCSCGRRDRVPEGPLKRGVGGSCAHCAARARAAKWAKPFTPGQPVGDRVVEGPAGRRGSNALVWVTCRCGYRSRVLAFTLRKGAKACVQCAAAQRERRRSGPTLEVSMPTANGYTELRKAGLCVVCGKADALPKRVRCEGCATRQNTRKAEKRRRARSAGGAP
jgi:hypothetical protein